ncbi:hypothetical protein [Halogeometricum sp. CBA1124]|uniref:hypothetical protein n=1 Tax=Halogeometricum sp. CBA1124 TaxID=2668071 RepID=UPI00142A8EAE|nr:hypothetical protein [Halogeometricum sp. CBA1124]MUV58255.1 hypothetical protein [Halogeometricum sp. CBA1124]
MILVGNRLAEGAELLATLRSARRRRRLARPRGVPETVLEQSSLRLGASTGEAAPAPTTRPASTDQHMTDASLGQSSPSSRRDARTSASRGWNES